MEAIESPIVPAEDLDRLELQIARRADELTLRGGVRGRDLEHWLQAEREIIWRCDSNSDKTGKIVGNPVQVEFELPSQKLVDFRVEAEPLAKAVPS